MNEIEKARAALLGALANFQIHQQGATSLLAAFDEYLTAREQPAPATGGEDELLAKLARWHSRLLAEQQANSPVFFPHDKDDGSLSTAVLDAMIELDKRQRRIAELEQREHELL